MKHGRTEMHAGGSVSGEPWECTYLGDVGEVLQDEGRVGHADAQYGAAVARQCGRERSQQIWQRGVQVAAVRARVLAAQPHLPHLPDLFSLSRRLPMNNNSPRICLRRQLLIKHMIFTSWLNCFDEVSASWYWGAESEHAIRPPLTSDIPMSAACVQCPQRSFAEMDVLHTLQHFLSFIPMVTELQTRRPKSCHSLLPNHAQYNSSMVCWGGKEQHQRVGSSGSRSVHKGAEFVGAELAARMLCLAVRARPQAARRQRQNLHMRISPHLHTSTVKVASAMLVYF